MISKADTIAITLLANALMALGQPAQAQSYHYSWGNSRVVMQNQTGLYTPSATYIGGGTISRSAQGLPAGVSSSGLNGLPQTHFGANVGTPGDNQYTDRVQYARHYSRQQQMPAGRMSPCVGTPGDNMRSDLHPYTPGQNARNASSPYGGQGDGAESSTAPQTNAYNISRSGAFNYN
jgi:hypothetical protein